MNAYRCFLNATLLSTKAKRTTLGFAIMLTLLLALFQSPVKSLVMKGFEPRMLIPSHVLLFLLAIVVCSSVQLWYIKTPEYQYLRTMPVPKGLQLLALGSRSIYMVLGYTMISVFFCDQGMVWTFLQLLYAPLMLLALSTFVAHMVYIVLRIISRDWRILFAAYIVAFGVLALLVYRVFAVNLLAYDFRHNGFVMVIYDSLVKVNLIPFCMGFLWLLLLHRCYRPYEAVSMPISKSSYAAKQRIAKGTYGSLLAKDFAIARSKPIYLIIFLFYLVMGAYSVYYRFDATINMIIVLILTIVFSTLSEELMASDMNCLPLIRMLPVGEKAFFWAKIGAVSTVLTIPSTMFLLIVFVFGTNGLGSFLICLAITLAVGFLWCAMQCIVVFDNINSSQRTQMTLVASIFISFVLPIFPILFILLRKNHALQVFGKESDSYARS